MPKKESGMWRKKNAPMSKNYRQGGSTYMGGGMTPAKKSAFFKGPKKSGIAEIQEGDLKQVRPGMKKGGTFGNFKVPTLDGKPRRITRKTPQESKVRKKPGMAAGGKLQQQQENQKKAHQGPKLKTIGSKSTKAKATKVKFPKGVLLNSPEGRALSKKKPQERKVRKKPGMGSGGMTINKRTLAKMTPKQLASDTMSEYFTSKVNESKGRKRGPGMARGGNLTINKKLIAKMTPKELKSKTMTDYFNSKVSESRKGRKKGPGR